MVNFEHISHIALSDVSTFEQVIVCWVNLCINKPIQNIQESGIQ